MLDNRAHSYPPISINYNRSCILSSSYKIIDTVRDLENRPAYGSKCDEMNAPLPFNQAYAFLRTPFPFPDGVVFERSLSFLSIFL